jgi:N utilization substance protein A
LDKILDIIESISHEKGISIDNVKEALKAALYRTAKKMYGMEYEYDVEINESQKEILLFQKVLVVENSDERLEEENENYITIDEAKELDPDVELGDELRYPLPLDNLGRTAVATLFRELEFHIQRFVEQELYTKYNDMVGKVTYGTVARVDSEETTFVEVDEVKARLPRKNRIKGEKFKVGDVVKAVIRSVRIDKAQGIIMELSRTTPKFLEALLTNEVPEIADEQVIIEKSARIPGDRAKVALTSLSPKVDAVGSTVGVKGVRINAVGAELNGENIDCIEYTLQPELFVARSLSPAIIKSVKIDGEKAIVIVPKDQKSKAIGRAGINIRLASMLTGYQIELIEQEGEAEVNKEALEETPATEEQPKDPNALKNLFGDL